MKGLTLFSVLLLLHLTSCSPFQDYDGVEDVLDLSRGVGGKEVSNEAIPISQVGMYPDDTRPVLVDQEESYGLMGTGSQPVRSLDEDMYMRPAPAQPILPGGVRSVYDPRPSDQLVDIREIREYDDQLSEVMSPGEVPRSVVPVVDSSGESSDRGLASKKPSGQTSGVWGLWRLILCSLFVGIAVLTVVTLYLWHQKRKRDAVIVDVQQNQCDRVPVVTVTPVHETSQSSASTV